MTKNLRNTTLVFLIKKSDNKITDVCLAMKKRGFGVNRWNGTGGKVEESETIKNSAKRETKEEVGVNLNKIKKVAELSFYFPHNLLWNQVVHVFLCDNWDGKPTESEEMRPKWFRIPELPFSQMWPDDKFWLPQVLEGKLLRATFKLGESDIIIKKKIEIVDKF
ncbi:MAG: 8-oxo-dGTP diphosphatase [Candidatus Vogelbacteria bacterium]|nr:8-oxo-dGTP diphosphatase [Candidatus Vogelbacteria bacterium]